MHPVLKIIVGALMVVLGVYSSLTYSAELIDLVTAVIGPLLVLVGAFIIWLESDELKLSREESSDRGFDVQQSLKDQTETTKQEETETPESQQTTSDRIACPDCGKEFDTERGMKIHRTQKHK